jgi:hypothetical protein
MNARVNRKPHLRRELVIALLLKFAAIYVLWLLFFSHPLDEHLDEARVGATVFGVAPASNPLPNNSPINSPNNSHNNEENQ